MRGGADLVVLFFFWVSVVAAFSVAVVVQFVQSRKNPVSASAMLTGKFLQIRKVFATSSLLAKGFSLEDLFI